MFAFGILTVGFCPPCYVCSQETVVAKACETICSQFIMITDEHFSSSLLHRIYLLAVSVPFKTLTN